MQQTQFTVWELLVDLNRLLSQPPDEKLQVIVCDKLLRKLKKFDLTQQKVLWFIANNTISIQNMKLILLQSLPESELNFLIKKSLKLEDKALTIKNNNNSLQPTHFLTRIQTIINQSRHIGLELKLANFQINNQQQKWKCSTELTLRKLIIYCLFVKVCRNQPILRIIIRIIIIYQWLDYLIQDIKQYLQQKVKQKTKIPYLSPQNSYSHIIQSPISSNKKSCLTTYIEKYLQTNGQSQYPSEITTENNLDTQKKHRKVISSDYKMMKISGDLGDLKAPMKERKLSRKILNCGSCCFL